MNAGLSNLLTLKKYLLPSTWQDVTAEDDAILAVGLGMAGLLEGHCARKFQRTVGATQEFDAAACIVQLERFPLETFTSLELQTEPGGDWEDVTDSILRHMKSGMVKIDGPLASEGFATLRATFTGGFWWDTTEDDTGSLPSGATAIPAALQMAWISQCVAVYARMKNDGITAALANGSAAAASAFINGIELLPVVEKMVQPYRILAA